MEEKLKVIVVPVEGEAYKTIIANDFESMQNVVKGYFEIVNLEFNDVVLVCNEEGLTRDLPENILNIRGTFFFVGVSGSDFVSLTEQECESLLQQVRERKG